MLFRKLNQSQNNNKLKISLKNRINQTKIKNTKHSTHKKVLILKNSRTYLLRISMPMSNRMQRISLLKCKMKTRNKIKRTMIIIFNRRSLRENSNLQRITNHKSSRRKNRRIMMLRINSRRVLPIKKQDQISWKKKKERKKKHRLNRILKWNKKKMHLRIRIMKTKAIL